MISILLIGFILSLFLFFIYIKKYKNNYQTVREEGPLSHKVKNGTITMGGIIIFINTLIMFFIFNRSYSIEVLFLLIPFFVFFLIGLIDDYLKVKKRNNNGLSSNIRLLIEIITSAIMYIIYIKIFGNSNIKIFNFIIDLKWFYGLFIIFLLVGGSNSCNITDGIDGLLGGISIIVLIGLLYISIKSDNKMISYFIISLISSLLGFLYFNLPKASIFMGDCGSLLLGGIIISICILLHIEILIPILLIIPIIETLSVIIQVIYFKITKGKRLFKMAPIHHHLEYLGFSEIGINILFYFITIIGVILSIYFYNIYF